MSARLTERPVAATREPSATAARSPVGYAFAYDARGQVTATAENVGTTACAINSGYTTSATYNDAGQLTQQTYPDGDVLTPSYDSVSGWQNQLSVKLNGSLNALALLTNEAYSGAAGAMGLLTSATLGAFSGGSGSYTTSYDALSNVIENVTTLPQGTDTQVFCEDDLSRLTWAGSSGTPACSGAPTPSDTGGLAGTGAQYSAAYAYDAMNWLTSSPLGSYTYGNSAHADAATAIGSSWTASYDTNGDLLCRAATSATSCPLTGTQTGAQLRYGTQGQLATWQNTPSSPTSADSFLYDGEGHRVTNLPGFLPLWLAYLRHCIPLGWGQRRGRRGSGMGV